MSHSATVAVIGAGQAGLSAAFHLARKGYVSAVEDPTAEKTFVVFDCEDAPGGAWLHRWDGLTMATVNGIFDLPGMHKPDVAENTPARTAIPDYFAEYEELMKLPILRPVIVEEVDDWDRGPGHLPGFSIAVRSKEHDVVTEWEVRAVINATGTYYNPVEPQYPGAETFTGRQLHSRDYESLEDFRDQNVAIVGGGISAVQLLEEVSRVAASTHWYTRLKPKFKAGRFTPEMDGRETINNVIASVEAGEPVRSIVSFTGLHWSEAAKKAYERGALNRKPMFTEITPTGVIEESGDAVDLDAIIWATGYLPALAHLEDLHLRNDKGGFTMKGTAVVSRPGLFLIGYGPSQSTVGANRAGRDAVIALNKLLRDYP